MTTRPKTAKQADKIPDDLPFESAIDELEALLLRMEDSKLSLEDSLAAYRRGALLLRHCQGQLDAADERLSILENDVLKPFSLDVEDGA